MVGGYSIWTNEPLACIQVRDGAFKKAARAAQSRHVGADQIKRFSSAIDSSLRVTERRNDSSVQITQQLQNEQDCEVKQWAGLFSPSEPMQDLKILKGCVKVK